MAKASKFVASKQATKEIVQAAADIAAADEHHVLALELAKVFDESETLNEQVENNLAANEEIKMGPLTMFLFLQDVYGDLYQKFPVPFTKDGNNPAVYQTMVPGKDGIMKPKDVSWYKVDFVPTTDKGKELQKEVDAITAKLNDVNNTEPKVELQSQKATATARLNAFVNLIERAVALDLMIDAINDLPSVECGYLKDKDGNPVTSTKPMWVASSVKGEGALKCKNMSIGAFLGFKVDVARDNGGTYDALIKTLERGAGNGTAKEFKIENTDHFEAVTPEYNSFLRDVIKTPKTLRSLVSDLEKDDAYVDSLIETADLVERLMQVTEIQQVVARREAKKKKVS